MDYVTELENIRQKNDGILNPVDVVDYAKNPETALHKYFEWDDTEAAEKYRLEQARGIIRVAVVVNPVNGDRVRAYVSLRSDRSDGNSYRALAEVLTDRKLTDILLREALSDLTFFTRKYDALREAAEMAGVFTAINSALQDNTRAMAG